jgi:ATP-binding cassette subfamily B protein
MATPSGLWSRAKRNAWRYAGGIALLAIYQGAQYAFDLRLRDAINAVLRHRGEGAFGFGAMLAAIACSGLVAHVLARLAIFNAGRVTEYELRRSLSEHLLLLGPAFCRRMGTGEITSRVMNDLGQVRMLMGFGVLNATNTLFALVSALSIVVPISLKLTLVALFPLPVLLFVTLGVARRFYERTRENQDILGRASARVQSSLSSVRVVRSFALEAHEVEAFERENRAYLDSNLKLAYLRGSFGLMMQGTLAVGILAVFVYGGHLVLTKALDPGGFLAFCRAVGRLTIPLVSIGFLIGLIQRGRASYSRLHEILSAEPDVASGPLAAPSSVRGHLAVRELSFSHPESPEQTLERISFELEPGESMAIVGRTGSGKSTLAALLVRLLATPRGTVFLDGVDICDLPLQTVRGAISYTQQSAFLFSTTVGRNIGLTLDDPDDAESQARIREAASEARILDEIEALPDAFDTIVGERGVQLSGGQRQRVALASAFVSNARVLVLDDPVSAVDGRTERRILETLERQRAKRSVVLITHRVAAAAACDRILVLERGRIVEAGTHAELLLRGGRYSSFAEEQRIQTELEDLSHREAAGA